jgi:hypothetical protein
MRKILNFLFRKNLYFSLIFVFMLLSIIISRVFNLDILFNFYYTLNHSAINNSFISFFGVLFAFLFTIMSILFSMNKDSLFIELLEKTKRTKKDIISYFTFALIPFAFVIIISLFFTIIGNGVDWLVYVLYYFVIFSLVNLFLFLITFILILRG